MKLSIDVPDDDRKLRVYKGRELIAFSEGDTLFLKTRSCNLCGECCMSSPNTIYGNDDEGKCNKLKKHGDTWECTAGVAVPWNCLDDPKDVPSCSIRYKIIKLR